MRMAAPAARKTGQLNEPEVADVQGAGHDLDHAPARG